MGKPSRPFGPVLVLCAVVLALVDRAGPAEAHHGWGIFNVEAPAYVEGRIVDVTWGNPHPTVTIELGPPANAEPWRSWTPPQAWIDLGAGPVLDRVTVNRTLTGRVFMEFGSLHRQSGLGFSEPPRVGKAMQAIVFPSCKSDDRTRSGALIMRPSLVRYEGRVMSQQSHRLPPGCSGRRTLDF
jgi:hypothetical protein